MARTMRIAMIASECEPWAKTGGLADVVDALSRALQAPAPTGPGHEVDVYMPYYRGLTPPVDLVPLGLRVPVGSEDGVARHETVTLWSGEADGYRLRLVEHAPSFDRDSYYMDGTSDYVDNPARFTLLGRAVLEAIRAEARPVDVIHGHDWQSSPALLSLRHRYGGDPLLAGAATMLTCHNLAYHGWTPNDALWQLDLPERVGDNPDGIDLLREAILAVDMVNTVSPTYAAESLTPEYGAGLDDALEHEALDRRDAVGRHEHAKEAHVLRAGALGQAGETEVVVGESEPGSLLPVRELVVHRRHIERLIEGRDAASEVESAVARGGLYDGEKARARGDARTEVVL